MANLLNNSEYKYPPNECPSAIQIHKEFGISKKNLHSIICGTFNFPSQYVESLSNYFIRHWETSYFMLKNEDGIISCEGNNYIIIYYECSPHIIHSMKNRQVKLSFRFPRKDLHIPGYVLVVPLDKEYDNLS